MVVVMEKVTKKVVAITDATATTQMRIPHLSPPLLKEATAKEATAAESSAVTAVQNADATQLVLGLAIRLPDTPVNVSLAKAAVEDLLHLCANDMAGSLLACVASIGLCGSLTNPMEFVGIL